MSDLEKLARRIVDESPPPGVGWDNDVQYEAQVEYIREELESVYKQGRIEGLKDAAVMLQEEYLDSYDAMDGYKVIRACIEELKGE